MASPNPIPTGPRVPRQRSARDVSAQPAPGVRVLGVGVDGHEVAARIPAPGRPTARDFAPTTGRLVLTHRGRVLICCLIVPALFALLSLT